MSITGISIYNYDQKILIEESNQQNALVNK